MDIFFECPKCAGPLISQSEWEGGEVACPHCREVLVLPGEGVIGNASLDSIDAAIFATVGPSKDSRPLRRLMGPTLPSPGPRGKSTRGSGPSSPSRSSAPRPPAKNGKSSKAESDSPSDQNRLHEENERLSEQFDKVREEMDEMIKSQAETQAAYARELGEVRRALRQAQKDLQQAAEEREALQQKLHEVTTSRNALQQALGAARHLPQKARPQSDDAAPAPAIDPRLTAMVAELHASAQRFLVMADQQHRLEKSAPRNGDAPKAAKGSQDGKPAQA